MGGKQSGLSGITTLLLQNFSKLKVKISQTETGRSTLGYLCISQVPTL
jgi:hypothetical protein